MRRFEWGGERSPGSSRLCAELSKSFYTPDIAARDHGVIERERIYSG